MQSNETFCTTLLMMLFAAPGARKVLLRYSRRLTLRTVCRELHEKLHLSTALLSQDTQKVIKKAFPAEPTAKSSTAKKLVTMPLSSCHGNFVFPLHAESDMFSEV
jgi:hypothetical protein